MPLDDSISAALSLAQMTDAELEALPPDEFDRLLAEWEDVTAELDGSFIPSARQAVALDLIPQVDRLLYGGAAGGGKANAVSTPILTTVGWKTMGTVEVGDQVFDERGQPCNVTHLSEIDYEPEAWRLTFDDGSEILADSRHEWCTDTGTGVAPRLTASIATSIPARHTITRIGSLDIPGQRFYVTGAERVPPVPMRCIQVDSPSHQYLVGRALIPTHNSHLAVHHAIATMEAFPGARSLIVRRVLPSLKRTIMPALQAVLAPSNRATWLDNDKTWTFPNGSVIELGAVGVPKDLLKFSGPEYILVVVEEAGEFPETFVDFLSTRLRTTIQGAHPHMLLTANPVGPGLSWMRRDFVLPPPAALPTVPDDVKVRIDRITAGAYVPWADIKGDYRPGDRAWIQPEIPWTPITGSDGREPYSRAFVPAKLSDNPHLTAADPGYAKRLGGLGDEKMRNALARGDWTAMDGSESAKFNVDSLNSTRVHQAPELSEVVISVDPSGSKAGDAVGIVVAGRCHRWHMPHLYVLADLSGQYAAHEWPEVVIDALDEWEADSVVFERNFGGDMGPALITQLRSGVLVHTVWASRGKTVRMDPVANLWRLTEDQGGPRAHIVGHLPELEGEITTWVEGSDWSPGRYDALAWAGHHLIVGESAPPSETNVEELLSRPRILGRLAGGR